MAKRKMSKQSKRRFFIFGTVSICLIGYFVFSASYYAINIYKLKKEEIELSKNLNELQHNEKLLNTEIDKLKDKEYIARFARENYLYSKDGEIIIKIDESKSKDNKSKKSEYDYYYIIKIGSIIIIVILFYVIIKNHLKKKKKKKGRRK